MFGLLIEEFVKIGTISMPEVSNIWTYIVFMKFAPWTMVATGIKQVIDVAVGPI